MMPIDPIDLIQQAKDDPGSTSRTPSWAAGLLHLGKTVSVILGISGLGMLGGLAVGAWNAFLAVSTGPSPGPGNFREFEIVLTWVAYPLFYGLAGFMLALLAAVGVALVGGIVRLVHRLVG